MNNSTGPQPAWREPAWAHGALRNYTDLDAAYPLMPYGKETNKSILVKAILTKSGVKRVSFLPLLIDSLYRPEVLHQGDKRFDEVVQFMDWSSEDFNHKFTVEGNEVIVEG
jgi:poly-gamma-glutamate synthesis protein (capsule biosynthesis protein)